VLVFETNLHNTKCFYATVYHVEHNEPIFNHLRIAIDENVNISNNVTAQHYVKANLVILTDFVTNKRLHKTLKISTKLVLWMSRKQQNKSDLHYELCQLSGGLFPTRDHCTVPVTEISALYT